MKIKTCSVCGFQGSMWKSKPLLCKNCASKNTASPVALKSVRKPIAKVSVNRQEALKVYRRKRDKYFEEHPVCEFPDCNSKNITLHHMRGRIGAFLTDKRFFKSLCHKHHRYVEENPLEAYKLNLSAKRLDK